MQNKGFVEESDNLYCENCYDMKFAPHCDVCNEAIVGVSRYHFFVGVTLSLYILRFAIRVVLYIGLRVNHYDFVALHSMRRIFLKG